MFTGLIQATGRIDALRPQRNGQSVRLVVTPLGWTHTPSRGDSISISGCCLTVANQPAPSNRGQLEFDVVPETLAKTKLGSLKVGSSVNLEHAARLDTLMGGHLVQGHIDGVATVVAVTTVPGWRVRVAVPASAGDLMQYIILKGSICLDGVSLTVAALWNDPRSARRGFEVALIPETLERATLKSLRRGHPVNLEVDMIAKTVVHWLRHFAEHESSEQPTRRPRRAHTRD